MLGCVGRVAAVPGEPGWRTGVPGARVHDAGAGIDESMREVATGQPAVPGRIVPNVVVSHV